MQRGVQCPCGYKKKKGRGGWLTWAFPRLGVAAVAAAGVVVGVNRCGGLRVLVRKSELGPGTDLRRRRRRRKRRRTKTKTKWSFHPGTEG